MWTSFTLKRITLQHIKNIHTTDTFLLSIEHLNNTSFCVLDLYFLNNSEKLGKKTLITIRFIITIQLKILQKTIRLSFYLEVL